YYTLLNVFAPVASSLPSICIPSTFFFNFLYYFSVDHSYIHSFPTRRSSDLYGYFPYIDLIQIGYSYPYSSCRCISLPNEKGASYHAFLIDEIVTPNLHR